MQQKRLEHTLDWVKKTETATEKALMRRTKETRIPINVIAWEESMLSHYKAMDYALNKAIRKKVRMDGSRAHCPDCGTNIRFSDNYCRKCGQRLAREEPKRSYYERHQKKGGSKSK